jgi:SAM-dependent methyltransferase
VLRLRGLNTTPEHHAAFFRRWLRKAGRRPRVLISGTADYSLLAQILPVVGKEARVTVLDRCATPLALNRWYARREGMRISTRHADILDYRPRERFDVICTHSFLGQFPPRRRARLLARWHDMLHPGGQVLTINRLRPGAPPGRLGFSRAQAAAFEALVGEEHRGAARQYARRMGAWPIRSEAELAQLFRRAGFEVASLSAEPLVLQGKRLSAPTTPGGASYACIAARRL